MTTIGVQKSYYSHTEPVPAVDVRRTVPADRPIERWLVAARIQSVTSKLQNITDPIVRAAMKEVPAVSGPAYHRKLSIGDPHSEKGGSYWQDSVKIDGHTVNYRFLVTYDKDGRENHLNELQVSAFYDKPVDDHVIADLYVHIGVQDDQAVSLRFGGRHGTPLSDMPDNYIRFDETGVNYTGWQTDTVSQSATILRRTYNPHMDTFLSVIERGDHTVFGSDVTPSDIVRIAELVLKMIPTEDNRT
jgi:hypothetical protein